MARSQEASLLRLAAITLKYRIESVAFDCNVEGIEIQFQQGSYVVGALSLNRSVFMVYNCGDPESLR
eukprot:9073151-Lingulodinium_polyedra.AAC.1